jgi:hypothetical protein
MTVRANHIAFRYFGESFFEGPTNRSADVEKFYFAWTMIEVHNARGVVDATVRAGERLRFPNYFHVALCSSANRSGVSLFILLSPAVIARTNSLAIKQVVLAAVFAPFCFVHRLSATGNRGLSDKRGKKPVLVRIQ